MSEDIPKISNVKYEITNEVMARKWSEANAKRNRLLMLSDWTQLPDVNIPLNIKKLWMNWRAKVRNVKKATINDPSKALALLNSLEQQMPEKINPDELPEFANPAGADFANVENNEDTFKQFKKYIDDVVRNDLSPKIVSLDDIKKLMDEHISRHTEILTQHFNDVVNNKFNVLKNNSIVLPDNIETAKTTLKMILNEKCNKRYTHSNHELVTEAIDYLSNPKGKFPLLQVYANNLNKSLENMAKDVIESKKEWLRQICQIEDFRLKYLNKIDSSFTLAELNQIKIEIL
jgi:hypothetical protein